MGEKQAGTQVGVFAENQVGGFGVFSSLFLMLFLLFFKGWIGFSCWRLGLLIEGVMAMLARYFWGIASYKTPFFGGGDTVRCLYLRFLGRCHDNGFCLFMLFCEAVKSLLRGVWVLWLISYSFLGISL